MKTSDFAKELKELDPRLTVDPNPNRPGLSNIKVEGKDICPIPSDEIKEETDPHYFYTFPNGMMAAHNSRQEALVKVQKILDYIKTQEGREVFFGS